MASGAFGGQRHSDFAQNDGRFKGVWRGGRAAWGGSASGFPAAPNLAVTALLVSTLHGATGGS